MEPLFNLGIQLIQNLQAMSPILDGVMKFFSFVMLGAPWVFLKLKLAEPAGR